MKKHILITLLILIYTPIFAQIDENKIQFNGFIDTYHAIRTKAPNNLMSSRTRFRGELQKAFDKSSIFLSFNFNQNSLIKELNNFELREAYFDYYSSHWALRAGRQLIIWGTADGLRITDLISPLDMTEFLARDYDDIRMPVEAIKLSYFNEILRFDLVYIPVFKSFILPTNKTNPWYLDLERQTGGISPQFKEANKPKTLFKNGDFGFRLSFTLPSIDFSIASLHTWNKMPVFDKILQDNTLYIIPTYKRMTFIGGDFAKPLGAFVLRGELAYNFNENFAAKTVNSSLQRRNTMHSLLGLDWYASNNWILSAQFSWKQIFKYSENLDAKKHSLMSTLNISKTLLNNTLKLSNFIYIDLYEKGLLNRFCATYALTDQIQLFIGYDYFYGKQGIFEMYKDNSEIWIKAKYNF